MRYHLAVDTPQRMSAPRPPRFETSPCQLRQRTPGRCVHRLRKEGRLPDPPDPCFSSSPLMPFGSEDQAQVRKYVESCSANVCGTFWDRTAFPQLLFFLRFSNAEEPGAADPV